MSSTLNVLLLPAWLVTTRLGVVRSGTGSTEEGETVDGLGLSVWLGRFRPIPNFYFSAFRSTDLFCGGFFSVLTLSIRSRANGGTVGELNNDALLTIKLIGYLIS